MVRLDVTLTVAPKPAHVDAAAGVNPLITGNAFTLNVEVLPLDNGAEQSVEVFCMEVTVIVVEPVPANEPDGIVKVPLPPTVVSDAVLPVAELAPVRLYVTV